MRSKSGGVRFGIGENSSIGILLKFCRQDQKRNYIVGYMYVGDALREALPIVIPSMRKMGANIACHDDTKHRNLKKNNYTFND